MCSYSSVILPFCILFKTQLHLATKFLLLNIKPKNIENLVTLKLTKLQRRRTWQLVEWCRVRHCCSKFRHCSSCDHCSRSWGGFVCHGGRRSDPSVLSGLADDSWTTLEPSSAPPPRVAKPWLKQLPSKLICFITYLMLKKHSVINDCRLDIV